MEKDNKNAYSEVIEILKFLDDEEKLEALPIEMLEVLKSKANPEYKPQISKDIPLDEQNLQPETLAILTWIAVKYWNGNIDVNESAQLSKNEDIKEEIATDVNEEDEPKIEIEENINEEKLPVVYEHFKWYQKLKLKIVEFFSKIFRRKEREENTL